MQHGALPSIASAERHQEDGKGSPACYVGHGGKSVGGQAMDAPSGKFSFSQLERVIFGPGKIAELGKEIDARGLKRALVVTGRSLGASKLLDQVTGALGARCVGVFKGVSQHVPNEAVRALVAEARRVEAQVLVSFGGGSPIDAAKVAAASLMEGRDVIAEAGELNFEKAVALADRSPSVIQIAVPTTLSAGEFTPAGGTTNEKTRVKRGILDPRVMPRVIIHDPALTVETPDWLWASTGMRALDHAIEAIYSLRHQPFADTLAVKAIKLLVEHLPKSIAAAGEARIAHRGYCQTAAWFSIFGGMNTGFGLSHSLGHQIGPTWNVPHGITSCITLPHAMRYMADIMPERFELIAEGLGVAFDAADPKRRARACADRVAEFIAGFAVPNTLGKAGVARDQVASIAQRVCNELAVFPVIKREISLADVTRLIEGAY
jgi:maleylacetate reductase